MTLLVAVPLVALAALLGTCAWVYRDAEANADSGTPVVFRMGSLRIDTAEAWAVGCVVLFVVFVPLYLAARKTDL